MPVRHNAFATEIQSANDRLTSDTYDANGNTRTATLRERTSGVPATVNDRYDFENRLVDRNNGEITVVYNGDGHRVQKTVNGITTHYLVDELNPTGYPQVLEELTSTGSNPTPQVTRVYTWGHALLSQDQVLDVTNIGLDWYSSFYGYDGQSSVRQLTDINGFVTDTYEYDAFGNLISESAFNGAPTPNNYLYQGEQYDRDLKLYYLRARYADPDRGRFWTMDSFEGFGSDPASLHKYTFNHNDPVNRRDPSGHFSLSETQTVTGLAPMVRGMLQALRQSLLSCRMQAAMVGGLIGGSIGAAVGSGITAIIQSYTGEHDVGEILAAAADGFRSGFVEGFLLGLNPYAFMAYMGFTTFQAGMEFWEVLHDPGASTGHKFLSAIGFVSGVLPFISPKLARTLSDKLQKFCFAEGTLVATAEGSKPIEEIREGDLVWAQSDQTGEVALKPVKQIFVNVATALVLLTAGTNTIEVSFEHPFWVANQGWKAAGQLKIGDELFSRSGTRIVLESTICKKGHYTVYNFEVQDFHTYFVTEAAVLAHNACVFAVSPSVTKVGNQITRVTSRILPGNLNGGTGTTKAARDAMEAGDDAGHIIGRLLGGKGGITSDNVFSQNPHINRGAFAQHEQWVADQVRSGRRVEVDVQLNYSAGSTRAESIIYDTYVDGVLIRKIFGN